MLLLFETAGGFALFKVLKGESKIKEAESEVRRQGAPQRGAWPLHRWGWACMHITAGAGGP